MPDYPPLRTAEFNPRVKTYYMLTTIILCVIIPVVGWVALPFAIIFGNLLIQKYLDNLSCVLTERTLELKRGMLNKTESTIPLEKITDLLMYQGPIMRHFGLHGFKVETAGQTAGAGTLMAITGIVDAPEFRQAVLAQRDALQDGSPSQAAPAGPTMNSSELTEIRDALLRIEKLLESSS